MLLGSPSMVFATGVFSVTGAMETQSQLLLCLISCLRAAYEMGFSRACAHVHRHRD